MGAARLGNLAAILFTSLNISFCGSAPTENSLKHAELLSNHFNTTAQVAEKNQMKSLGPWDYELVHYFVLPTTDKVFDSSIRQRHPDELVTIVVYRFRQEKTLYANANPITLFRDSHFRRVYAHPTATSNIAQASSGQWTDPWYLTISSYGEWTYVVEAFIHNDDIASEGASFGIVVEYTPESRFSWTVIQKRRHVVLFDLGTPDRTRPSVTITSN